MAHLRDLYLQYSVQKVALIFNSGIGNAITMIPLIKAIKERYAQAEVSGIFFDNYGLKELFESFNLLHKTHQASLFELSSSIKKYDLLFIDWLSMNKKTMLFSKLMSKSVVYHQKKGYKAGVEIPKNKSVAIINKALLQESEIRLSIADFIVNDQKKVSDYIALAPNCGHGKTPYKKWPDQNWQALIDYLSTNHRIVLLGDHNEVAKYKGQHIENKIGKTSLLESAEIISKAKLFVGHDSGLMHLAAVMNTPSFTIWGGSDHRLYGYQQYSDLHAIIHQKISCWPCNSWINPNIIRVDNPLACPDFKCIQKIDLKTVIQGLETHLKSVS